MKSRLLFFVSTGLVAGIGELILFHDLLLLTGQYIKLGFVPGAAKLLERERNFYETLRPSLLRAVDTIEIEVPPVILDPPIYYPHGTPEEAKLYLNNSISSFCIDIQEVYDVCMSKKTYSDIEVIDDRLSGGLAVVSANNRFKQIVVSFRPKQDLQNAVDNFDAGYSNLLDLPGNSTVYRGFYNIYLGLHGGLVTALDKKMNDPRFKDYVVHITGYSLGGPLAIYSIPDVYNTVKSIDPNRKIEVFTYMSPRAGNIDYNRYIASFNLPITRYNYGLDVVTRLPARALGFVHIGQELYTPADTHEVIVCSQKYDEDPECSYKFRHEIPRVDHHFEPFGSLIPFPPYY